MMEVRVTKLKELMKTMEIEGMLVSKMENISYFSGFKGSAGMLLVTPFQTILFTDSRYEEQAKIQTQNLEIMIYKDHFFSGLKEKLREFDIKKLGFESKEITFQKYNDIQTRIKGTTLFPIREELDSLREIKEPGEIEKIIRAVQLADRAFDHVLPLIKVGIKELEIAAEIEYFMKKNGARGTSFETIVASGIRSALPHGVASDKKLQTGDPIVLDFGAYLDDYCSDMTRTVFLGEPSPEMKKIYDVVKEAQSIAAIGLIKGMSAKDGDLLARDYITQHGYQDYFGHGLGHGVGLEIHEGPTLSYRNDGILENNMVVTVEPGIYLPKIGGVRIEDMLIIQNKTPQLLTSSNKEMIIL